MRGRRRQERPVNCVRDGEVTLPPALDPVNRARTSAGKQSMDYYGDFTVRDSRIRHFVLHRSGALIAGGVKTERQRVLANWHAIDSSVLMPPATNAMIGETQLGAFASKSPGQTLNDVPRPDASGVPPRAGRVTPKGPERSVGARFFSALDRPSMAVCWRGWDGMGLQ